MQSIIFQRLASVGQVAVAAALSVSEATISRMKGEGVESFTAFLACLGLKVVPAEHQCYEPAYIEHLSYFAKLGMAQAQPPKPLEFEE